MKGCNTRRSAAIALDSDGPAIRAESAERSTGSRDAFRPCVHHLYVRFHRRAEGVAVSHPRRRRPRHRRRLCHAEFFRCRVTNVEHVLRRRGIRDLGRLAQWRPARRDFEASAAVAGVAQKHIAEQGITTLFLTTALFDRVADQRPSAFAGVRQLLFAGEAADPGAVRKVLNAGRPAKLINVYGPTEATIFASWYPVESVDPEDTTIPIGRPISRTSHSYSRPSSEPDARWG